MTLGLITVSVFSLWAYLAAAAKGTGESIAQRRTFYVCDGVTRMLGLIVSRYAATTSSTTTDGARTFVLSPAQGGANLTNIIPPGYKLGRFDILDIDLAGDALPVPNGPFEGLLARESTMHFRLMLRTNDDEIACEIDKQLALSQIGIFQFGLLGLLTDEVAITNDNATVGALSISGRTHVDGNLCAGSAALSQAVYLERVSVGGNLYHGDPTKTVCSAASAPQGPYIATVAGDPIGGTAGLPAVGDFALLTTANDARTGGWTSSAPATWGPRAVDSALGGTRISLPGSTRMQAGRGTNGLLDIKTTQTGRRFLVDPPFDGENGGERQGKLAYQADLRIIDGVWYLRNPANPADWPGTPIWSDHPGATSDRVTQSFNERAKTSPARIIGVGQSLFGSPPPRRYSYYEYDAANHRLYDGFARDTGAAYPRGVISYGGIATEQLVVGDPSSVGHSPAVVSRVTGGGVAEVCGGDCTGGCPTASSATVGSGWCGSASTQYLRAASSTFWQLQNGPVLLPINFDVAAFQQALDDTSSGELGDYFDGAGREFNGIVWISSLYPGAWSGADPSQVKAELPPMATPTTGGIPYPLCSDGAAGLSFDSAAAIVPSCQNDFEIEAGTKTTPQGQAVQAMWPNAVRVINASSVNRQAATGARIDAGELPHGLTIATNLPLLVAGNVNVASTPAPTAAYAAGHPFDPWVPVLLAGDSITLLSSQWHDGLAKIVSLDGNGIPNQNFVSFTPTVPWVLNTSLLYGQAVPQVGNNYKTMHQSLRFMEQIDPSVPFVVRGSTVIGFRPVYAREGPNYTVLFPDRTELRFDYRLNRLVRQPPGGVSFTIESVRNWQRR